MKHWFWLALLAPAVQACELPGGAAQSLKSATYTVLYRTPPLSARAQPTTEAETNTVTECSEAICRWTSQK
jgi:hypothetical protein